MPTTTLTTATITGQTVLPGGTVPVKGTWYATVWNDQAAVADPSGDVRVGVEQSSGTAGAQSMTLPLGRYVFTFRASVRDILGADITLGPYVREVTANMTWGDVVGAITDLPITPSLVQEAGDARDAAQTAALQATSAAASVKREQTNGVAGLDGSGLLYLTRMPVDVTAALRKTDAVISLDALGAPGNGTADDAPYVTQALTLLPAGGGTILFGSGKTYRFATSVMVNRDNVTIDLNGSTIARTSSSDQFWVFVGQSFRGKGYGAGCRNVTIRNGTFQGVFSGNTGTGIGMAFHHAQYLTFDNIKFTRAMVSSHVMDLAGCQYVTVNNCVFEGSNISNQSSNLWRTEAIQLDFSYAVGLNVDTANAAARYDGLATRDVRITNCRFMPTADGAYPGPKPFGGHVRMEGQQIGNIVFQGNHVSGLADTAGDPSATVRGWIHLFSADNVKILDNKFVNQASRACVAIESDGTTGTTGYLLADVANPSATTGTIPAVTAQDWLIQGNTFKNFNAPSTSEHIILIKGNNQASVAARSIRILSNHFENCHPTPGTVSGTAVSAIQLFYATSSVIANNTGYDIGQAVYVNSSDEVTVANNRWGTCWAEPILVTGGATRVSITGNSSTGPGGVRVVTNSVKVTVSNNVLEWITGLRANAIELSGSVSNFAVAANSVNGTGATAPTNSGITVTNTCSNGTVTGNVSVGMANAIVTSANVLATANVTA